VAKTESTIPTESEQDDILSSITPVEAEAQAEQPDDKKKKKSSKVDTASNGLQNTKLDIKLIDLPERWNRDKAGDLKNLIQSIKIKGQLVPLAVRPNPEDPKRYILVDGRRRYMAMLDLGFKEVNVSYVNDDNDVDAYMTSMATNLARAGHNCVEIAESFSYLAQNGKKQKDIAASCCLSDAYVSQHIGILDLPPDILKLARTEKLNFAHLRVFKSVFNDEDMAFFSKLTDKVIQNNLPPDKADEAVAQYKERKRAREEAAGKKSKKTGRPAKKGKDPLDYDAISSTIKPIPKKEILELLKEYADRYKGSGSKTRTAYYEGFLHGAETVGGIRETK
jgi:ParB/RepB/Spo0J family partition protein